MHSPFLNSIFFISLLNYFLSGFKYFYSTVVLVILCPISSCCCYKKPLLVLETRKLLKTTPKCHVMFKGRTLIYCSVSCLVAGLTSSAGARYVFPKPWSWSSIHCILKCFPPGWSVKLWFGSFTLGSLLSPWWFSSSVSPCAIQSAPNWLPSEKGGRVLLQWEGSQLCQAAKRTSISI